MERSDLITIFSKISTPISQIEKEWGLPSTTLQKAIKGERKLPKKWALVVAEKLVAENNKPENKKKIEDARNAVPDPQEVEKRNAATPVTESECVADKREEILLQMKAVREEKIPKERDTLMGRKSWAIDQQKRISELQKKLDPI